MVDEYLLDSSVLIQAFKDYYAFDLVSTFWSHLIINPAISSIDKVRNEIDPKNKLLYDWSKNDFSRWESTHGEKTVKQYQKIMVWSNSHTQFMEHAKEEFADERKADAWLVAHALATKRVVVTEEKFNHNIKNRIPIPNVCKEFNVQFSNTFDMLRNLSIRLA